MIETDAQFDANRQVGEMAERVFRRSFANGFESLSPRDRCILCVYKVELEVKNGGLHQLMGNTGPHVLREIPSSLREIGAVRTAEIVEKSFSIVLPAGLAASEAEHESALDSVLEQDLDRLAPLDSQFYETGEHLCSLLLDYVSSDANQR